MQVVKKGKGAGARTRFSNVKVLVDLPPVHTHHQRRRHPGCNYIKATIKARYVNNLGQPKNAGEETCTHAKGRGCMKGTSLLGTRYPVCQPLCNTPLSRPTIYSTEVSILLQPTPITMQCTGRLTTGHEAHLAIAAKVQQVYSAAGAAALPGPQGFSPAAQGHWISNGATQRHSQIQRYAYAHACTRTHAATSQSWGMQGQRREHAPACGKHY